METNRVNQGSRPPFNPFNILCNEILLPCNQCTVIFSNFAELARVCLAPPWVLNSYSATRMLNRWVIYIYIQRHTHPPSPHKLVSHRGGLSQNWLSNKALFGRAPPGSGSRTVDHCSGARRSLTKLAPPALAVPQAKMSGAGAVSLDATGKNSAAQQHWSRSRREWNCAKEGLCDSTSSTRTSQKRVAALTKLTRWSRGWSTPFRALAWDLDCHLSTKIMWHSKWQHRGPSLGVFSYRDSENNIECLITNQEY